MRLIPAIDLLDGRVVRLAQGDYARETRFDTDPLRLAQDYEGVGATWLHVVDLDAARDGGYVNLPLIEQLCRETSLNIQTGGGVREKSDVERRFDAGAKRVVIGSVCVREPESVCLWLEEMGPERIVAALDVRQAPDDRWIPRAAGWQEEGSQELWDVLDILASYGLKHLLCTDIARDGMLTGPNTALYAELAARYPSLAIQASGGVGKAGDLDAVAETGATACIVGRAMLEGHISRNEILRWSP